MSYSDDTAEFMFTGHPAMNELARCANQTTEKMKCDFCNKEMDLAETGIHIMGPSGKIQDGLGGHMSCAVIFQKQIEESGRLEE